MKRIILITTLLVVYILTQGCCDPNKPVAMIYHKFKSYDSNSFIIVKGFDCDCDSDIDYWQHYDRDTDPFGPKMYTKGNEGKCEKK